LTGIELHVEGGKKRCRPGIIAHERDEIDQRAAAELPQRPCEGRRRHPPRAEDLAAELNDDRVGLVQAVRIAAVLDDLDDLRGDTLAERLGFVRCPFELAVELTGGGEDGQFTNPTSQPRLVSQVAVEQAGHVARARGCGA